METRELPATKPRCESANIGLEICVDSASGLIAAVENGADRIELCAALSEDGLTPSKGLMDLAARTGKPVRVMIRPRGGNFEYSAAELEVMRDDISYAAASGVEGVVLGCNRRSGDLDAPVLAELVNRAKSFGLKVTLHKCFDLSNDPVGALRLAATFGIDTVLTSGGQTSALAGSRRIAELVDSARAQEHPVQVMAGGGVTPENLEEVVQRTRADFIHASCSRPQGTSPSSQRETVPSLIARMKEVLDRLRRADETGSRTFQGETKS
jgi:copper homeostasis protein